MVSLNKQNFPAKIGQDELNKNEQALYKYFQIPEYFPEFRMSDFPVQVPK